MLRLSKNIPIRIKREISEIRDGGLNVFRRKSKMLFGLIISVPVLIILRLFSPLVLIRFGMLREERIGHYLANTELYLCARDAGLHPNNAFDLFFPSWDNTCICNHQLKAMWERTQLLRIWSPSRYLFDAARFWPGFNKHIIETSARDTQNLLELISPHLSFTLEEEIQGRLALQELGISDEAKIICFHARDAQYLKSVLPHVNCTNHDYRDSDISNYIFAAESLVERGYYLLRTGAAVEKPLTTDNPNIIDYATKYRTEFLDIYLGARCEFILCSATGISAVPAVFRKPIVYVNFIPLEYTETWLSNGLVIFKKLWLRNERRFMTLGEILESGAGRFLRTEEYDQLGIDVIENTPEEIAAVALEMDSRLNGTWQTTEGDECLQRSFWSIFPHSELHGQIRVRIGADFLRNNIDLLR